MFQDSIKGILFDLDGTLADTAPDLIQALNLSLDDAGFATHSVDELRYAASHGSLYLVNAAQPNLDETKQKELQQALLMHYQRINGDHSVLFPGMDELLALLDSLKMPYGVVTNKQARFARPLIAKLNLTHRLQSVVSGDSTAYPKPHTAPMLLAAQQIARAPQHILYLGDAERDLVAAQNAKMLGGVALWGYISAQDTPDLWPNYRQFSNAKAIMDLYQS